MKYTLNDCKIADFLYNLERGEDSIEKKAFSSGFISEHYDEIQDYIKKREASNFNSDARVYGDSLRKLVDRYKKAPKPYIINDSTTLATEVRSFRIAKQHDFSMTLPSDEALLQASELDIKNFAEKTYLSNLH